MTVNRDLDVLCLGEALVDLLPDKRGRLRDAERFEVCSGGAPANVAVGLARLGVRVALRGAVGDDEFGHLLARKLEEEGVETHLRFTREARTGVWFVAVDERGERTFFAPAGQHSADKTVTPADVDLGLVARAHWMHCGTSSHVRPKGREALRAAVTAAKSAGALVSCDPNVRAHLWTEPDGSAGGRAEAKAEPSTSLADLRALCDDVLPRCDLVKISEEEAEHCLGIADPGRALDRLAELGVKLACVTLGPKGALVRRGADRFQVPAPAVEVADTTGAGDGFVAGLLYRLARVDSIEDIPLARLKADVALACWMGARVCTRLGAVAALPRPGDLPPQPA